MSDHNLAMDLSNTSRMAIPTGFFASASTPPSIPATIRAAIQAINKSQKAVIQSWEELQINGKYLIREICDAIHRSDFFCADITGINPNVLFELGYAIATDKRIWLISDDSYSGTKKDQEQLGLLMTMGFSRYLNSEQVIKSFFNEQPHLTLDQTVFKQLIEPMLSDGPSDASVLYLKSRYDTEASVQVSRVLEDSKSPITIDDPTEVSVRPLYWYAEKLWNALGLVTHFVSPAREGFRIHNARYALVSGFASLF